MLTERSRVPRAALESQSCVQLNGRDLRAKEASQLLTALAAYVGVSTCVLGAIIL